VLLLLTCSSKLPGATLTCCALCVCGEAACGAAAAAAAAPGDGGGTACGLGSKGCLGALRSMPYTHLARRQGLLIKRRLLCFWKQECNSSRRHQLQRAEAAGKLPAQRSATDTTQLNEHNKQTSRQNRNLHATPTRKSSRSRLLCPCVGFKTSFFHKPNLQHLKLSGLLLLLTSKK
jgi:hypothetical protein